MQMFFAYYVLGFFSLSLFNIYTFFIFLGQGIAFLLFAFAFSSACSFTFVGQSVGRSVASLLWLNLLSGDTIVAKQWRRRRHAHVDHILLAVKWEFGRKWSKWQKTRCRCLLLLLLRMFHIRAETDVRKADRRRHSVQLTYKKKKIH